MHRPGWHVEWHKRISAEKSDQATTEKFAREDSKGSLSDSSNQQLVNEEADAIEKELAVIPSEPVEKKTDFVKPIKQYMQDFKESDGEVKNKKLVQDFVYDKGTFTFFVLSCVFFVLFLVFVLVNPMFTVVLPVFGKSFLWVVFAVLNVFFGIGAIVLHALHLKPKKERIKKTSKRSEMRSNQRIKRPLFVVASILLLVGLILLILFKYSLIFSPVILSFSGILLVSAALFIFILFMRYHLNDLHDQGKLFNRHLRLGLFFLFASLVITLFILLLFALNGWLLISSEISTFAQTMAIIAIILAPAAIVFALIGIGNIASVSLED